MGEEENITCYVSKVQNIVHLMKGCGETLTDKMIVEKVMCMLTSHFDQVIISIHESNILETMKLEGLVGLLEAHEMRIIERKGVQDSIQALQVQTWKKHGGSNKFKGKRDKTKSKKSWSNPQKHKVDNRASESPPKEKENPIKKREKKEEEKSVQCYSCEKWGHLAKNYWYRKDRGATKGKEEGENRAHED